MAYPNLYQRFLDTIALVNFDLSWIPSAGCIMDVNFHVGLIAATVGPLMLVALLGATYVVALRRSRGSEGAVKAIRRKHANAAIVIALLLYSSASSAAFRAFACDPLDDGKMYLRSDYRIDCRSSTHRAFQIYAAFMIVVYPFGTPALFAFLLFRNRKVLTSTSLRNNRSDLLQYSTSNLWEPYKPSAFYYEVVECGRRVMLTGVVVFIYPNSATQIAVTLAIAFVFAFTSERLDPYDSQWDRRVSRMAQIMVVLTMFEALLTKVDVSSEGVQSQRLFAGVLVGAHIVMVLMAAFEAFTLMCSVQEVKTTPLPRRRSSSITVIIEDGDSSCSKYNSNT